MKKCLFSVISVLLLFTVVNGQRSKRSKKAKTVVVMAPSADVYLRTVNITNPNGSTTDISWIYLGADSVIIKDPKYGVDPVDLVAEKAHNAGKTGKYSISGNKMLISWQNGKTAEWNLEYKDGQLTAIDGGSVIKQTPLPANYRITGQYSAGSILPNISSSSTIVFSKDGSFSQSNYGGVSTTAGSVVSQDISEGNYTITGNTIRLNYTSGNKAVSMISIWTKPNGKTHLIINNSSFPQE